MEAKAKLRATEAIHSLMSLKPMSAFVVQDDGETTLATPIEDIDIGSLIKVRAGEIVPLDAKVETGEALVDISSFTGEPYPVRKTPGDEIVGGCSLIDASLILKTTKVSGNTMLDKVLAMVEEAQNGKAPVQKLVDKIASIFVPDCPFIGFLCRHNLVCLWCKFRACDDGSSIYSSDCLSVRIGTCKPDCIGYGNWCWGKIWLVDQRN